MELLLDTCVHFVLGLAMTCCQTLFPLTCEFLSTGGLQPDVSETHARKVAILTFCLDFDRSLYLPVWAFMGVRNIAMILLELSLASLIEFLVAFSAC